MALKKRRKSKKKRERERKPCPIQRAQSNRKDKESASVGTGMTDLGGIGKTDGEQVYYIWRAIFTASTKGTQKVLSLTIPDQ